MAEKTITIRIDEKLHKEIKVLTAEQGITVKDYLVGLIKDSLYGKIGKEK